MNHERDGGLEGFLEEEAITRKKEEENALLTWARRKQSLRRKRLLKKGKEKGVKFLFDRECDRRVTKSSN